MRLLLPLLLITNLSFGQTNDISWLSLSGGAYMDIDRPLSLYNGDDASFSIWFRTWDSIGTRHFITNDTQPTDPEFNFGITDGYVFVNGGPVSFNGPFVISSSTYSNALWHHAVGIKSGSNCVELYVDNNFIGSDCDGSGAMDTGDAFYVGDNFIGALDEIKLYNKALNASEVDSLYYCLDPAIIDLITYYSFEWGTFSGDTVFDLVGNNDGICMHAWHSPPGEAPNCTPLTIKEPSFMEKKLIKIVNLLGQETVYKPNTPLIYIYSDGSTERVLKLEE